MGSWIITDRTMRLQTQPPPIQSHERRATKEERGSECQISLLQQAIFFTTSKVAF
jgi:hypothetical protein